jgi:hypothetical protein
MAQQAQPDHYCVLVPALEYWTLDQVQAQFEC